MISRTFYDTLIDDSGAAIPDGTEVDKAFIDHIYDDVDARWSVAVVALTGTQHNVNIAEADLVIFNNATDLTVTGFLAPAPAKPGKTIRIRCLGPGNVFFAHQTGSTGGNLLSNAATSAPTPCAPGGSAAYSYHVGTGLWYLTAHEQGAWITATFAAGNYTGNGAMTVTVDAGDVETMAYRLSGRTLSVAFKLNSFTTGGTPANTVSIGGGAWGGFTAAKGASGPTAYLNGVAGYTGIGAGGSTIAINKLDSSTFANGTNTNSAWGSVEFEVT